MDNILIGYTLGDAALGLYNQAYRILMLPIDQINPPANAVALPALSRISQSPSRYAEYFRQGLMVVFSISVPVVAFAFVASDEIILLVFGPQWAGIGTIISLVNTGRTFRHHHNRD